MRTRIASKLNSIIYFSLLTLFYGLAASQAIQSFSYKWTTVAIHEQYSLEKVLNREAPKPYAYRLLMPALVKEVTKAIPTSVYGRLLDRSSRTLFANIGSETALLQESVIVGYGLVLILGFTFLVLTLFALRELGYEAIPKRCNNRNVVIDTSPILFALFLSVTYRVFNGFIYDHLELLLISLYLLACFKEWKSIYIMLILFAAVLNKETAILLPLVGVALSYTRSKEIVSKKSIALLGSQFAVVLVGYIFVRIVTQTAPGTSVEWHLMGNINFWSSLDPFLSFTTPHTQIIPFPKPSNILVATPLVVILINSWQAQAKMVKSLILITASINTPLFAIFSYRDEFRNLSLMFPALYLAFTQAIYFYYTQCGNVADEENAILG